MSSAPSFLAWVPAATAASIAGTPITNYTFANNGGPGDTISDTLGTAAALTTASTGLNAVFDAHVVATGDRLLLTSHTSGAAYQNGIYIAAVETAFGQVATFNTIVQPTGTLTNGIYQNVALTGGAGTGVQATITVAGGVVTTVVVQNSYGDAPGFGGPISGSGYAAGNTLSFPVVTGLGTGGTANVATLAPAYVLTRVQNANTSEQFPGMSVFVSTGGTLAGKAFVQVNAPVTLDAFGVTTVTLQAPVGGAFVTGSYTNVALTGGHGTGAIGTVTVNGASPPVVTGVAITSAGLGYVVGDVLNFSGFGFGSSGTVTVATTTVAASSAVSFVNLNTV